MRSTRIGITIQLVFVFNQVLALKGFGVHDNNITKKRTLPAASTP